MLKHEQDQTLRHSIKWGHWIRDCSPPSTLFELALEQEVEPPQLYLTHFPSPNPVQKEPVIDGIQSHWKVHEGQDGCIPPFQAWQRLSASITMNVLVLGPSLNSEWKWSRLIYFIQDTYRLQSITLSVTIFKRGRLETEGRVSNSTGCSNGFLGGGKQSQHSHLKYSKCMDPPTNLLPTKRDMDLKHRRLPSCPQRLVHFFRTDRAELLLENHARPCHSQDPKTSITGVTYHLFLVVIPDFTKGLKALGLYLLHLFISVFISYISILVILWNLGLGIV